MYANVLPPLGGNSSFPATSNLATSFGLAPLVAGAKTL